MRSGSQLSLSVEKQISSKQGETKGGTKLKRNSVEAKRRAKIGKRRNTKAQRGHDVTDRTASLARRDKESWMLILIYALRETADK